MKVGVATVQHQRTQSLVIAAGTRVSNVVISDSASTKLRQSLNRALAMIKQRPFMRTLGSRLWTTGAIKKCIRTQRVWLRIGIKIGSVQCTRA
jgi:hypothetical protein